MIIDWSQLVADWVFLTHPWLAPGPLPTSEIYVIARQMILDATGGAVVS